MKYVWMVMLAFTLGFGQVVKAQDYDDYEAGYAGYADPLEGLNRGILAFNNVIDTALIYPVIRSYRAAVPEEGRDAVNNFLRNLRTPLNLGHNLLQADFSGAGTTLFRFVVNSLAGFGGILDVAGREGYAYESEDLGQTLAVWGVPDGFYIVVPFFGPASLRDGLGFAGDGYLNPISRYYDNIEEEHIMYQYSIAQYVDTRNELYPIESDLKRNSIDYYSALRSAVYQNRQAVIQDRNKKKTVALNFPSYEEF